LGKPKALKDRLFGAAVLKMSFRLRGQGAGVQGHLSGVLRDLELEDAAVGYIRRTVPRSKPPPG
jgi:hypothetical protein